MIYAVGMAQLYATMYSNQLSATSRMTLLQAENALRSIAQNTGGVAWFPRFQGEYRGIYEGVSYLLRNQYSIGFAPTNLRQDDKLREIKIEVNPFDIDGDGEPEEVKVRHKKGFYNLADDN